MFKSAACLLLVAGGVASAERVTFLRPGFIAGDLSADGRAAAGNLVGPYETFRWTEATGEVRLGASTVDVLGSGAGTPDISYDGTRISATIITEDNQEITWGLWTEGQGWQRIIPPMAADGRMLDLSYGSAWGLSGDGSTVTGFYWSTAGSPGTYGGARPATWSSAAGLVGLPRDPGRSARVNAANYDGSVVVGWEERFDGVWQPTVWRNGTKIRLSENEAFVECERVTADGGTVVGNSLNPSTLNREPTIWTWNGASYDEQRLGVLPGTQAIQGFGIALDVSDNAGIIGGVNFYTSSPGGPADGIIWTADTGLVKADDYIASLGIDIADEIHIRSVNAVSADGSTIAVDGQHPTTGALRGAIIRLDPGCSPADLAEPYGILDLADINAFIAGFTAQQPAADLDGNGIYDLADISEFVISFPEGCPGG
jgi:hypothetical protein